MKGVELNQPIIVPGSTFRCAERIEFLDSDSITHQYYTLRRELTVSPVAYGARHSHFPPRHPHVSVSHFLSCTA
jgi:hypothetical protein